MNEEIQNLNLKVIDYLLFIMEYNNIQKMKQECIKNQDYENASKIRSEELILIEKSPTYQQLKDLRDKIGKL